MVKQNRKFDLKRHFYFIAAAGRADGQRMEGEVEVGRREEGIITGSGTGQAFALRNFVLFWREGACEGKWCGKQNKEERGSMDGVRPHPLLLLLLLLLLLVLFPRPTASASCF